MAKRVRVKMNRQGADALLKSMDVQADLLRRAQAVAAGAGEGVEADVRTGRTRGRAMVKTVTFSAARRNARDNIILKNLDRGRT